MKKIIVPLIGTAALAVPFVHPADAVATCMGKPVDVMGTPKNDVISPSWEDDKNGDDWIVYAGGKGNDTFKQTDLDGGSVTNVIA